MIDESMMVPRRVRFRRGRRTDFVSTMQILASSGVPVPPPDRRVLRRFRRLVADLGADFYVAVLDGALVGFVHVTYARRLAEAPAARLEILVVAPHVRRRGIGRSLAALAADRARRRGCAELQWVGGGETAQAFLRAVGFEPAGALYSRVLGDGG